jgi:hypothetical protein
MAWWNGLTDSERAHWAALVGTGVAADAWEAFKNGVVIRETRPLGEDGVCLIFCAELRRLDTDNTNTQASS